MQVHFQTLTAGATIATIGMPELRQLVVPIPPHSQQEAIVEDIRRLQWKHDETVTRLVTQMELLGERRQTLISAAVTGEIPEAAA
jgi:type I restriction enzyme S subunit